VEGALPRLPAERRIGRFAGCQRGHRLLLIGDDDEEDVGRHDRAEQRADMEKCGPAAEHVGEGEREAGRQQEHGRRQPAGPPAER
jgi:hypothetical protein